MTHKLTPNKPAIIKAPEYNAAMEAGQWFSQQMQLGTGTAFSGGSINPCVILVENSSGSDKAAGDALELGASLLTTLDKAHIWLSAAVRSGDNVCGVLLDPIPNEKIGRMQLSGVCLAPVNIISTDDDTCSVVDGSATLQSDANGDFLIVYKPSGTGVKDCVVLLDRRNGKSDVLGRLSQQMECQQGMFGIDPDTTYELATGRDVDVSEAWNQFEIRGKIDDWVLLKWDGKYKRYIVAQVQHVCFTALVDVWDTEGCLMKIGACLSAPGVTKPEAGDTGCKIFDWTECASSSAALTCDDIWPGTACGECPPSSSGGG